MHPASPALVVAGLSARLMAESARRGGFAPLALDVFGDQDTRRVARAWLPVGRAGSLQLDATRLVAALSEMKSRYQPIGWVPGTGFEGMADAVEAAGRVLPVIGNDAEVIRALRDPAHFFARLGELQIPFPEVSATPPSPHVGWLRKDMHSSGGWHVRRATAKRIASAAQQAGSALYWQRRSEGQAIGALFVANGETAVVLGHHRQIVQPLGQRPFVHGGVIGPIALPASVTAAIAEIIAKLTRAYGLRGLNSLDLLLDGERLQVLELNPRPSASMAVHESASNSLMALHVAACMRGELPAVTAPAGTVGGYRIVFAPRRLALGDAALARLAARGDCHDIPAAALTLAPGDPICSLSARDADTDTVAARLEHHHTQLITELEQTP